MIRFGATPCLTIALLLGLQVTSSWAQTRDSWSAHTLVTRTSTAPINGWATSIVRLPAPPPPRIAPAAGEPHAMEGIASFYWQFERTANGETYDPKSLTAAHRTLPFNTQVKVVNLANGKSTVVRINNRGPYKAGRVIDLSEAAADAIEMRSRGLVPVKLEVIMP